MKKLVIFDLDGTLLNTIADLAAATNYALTQLGFSTHAIEEYPMFVGNGINKLFERALPLNCRDEAHIARMRSLFVPYYNIHNADLSIPYPGITELLQQLTEKGVAIAVASNKYQQATEKLIRHYFGNFHFTAILGQREGIPVKPDPTIVFDILKISNVTPQDSLYIGDSGVDMLTAQRAGVDAIGVTWGFRSREELLQGKPKAVIDLPADICKFL